MFEIKKKKVKNQKAVKNYYIKDEHKHSVQSADWQTEPKQCKSDIEEICIYQNLMESMSHHSIYLKMNSKFHARKNPPSNNI